MHWKNYGHYRQPAANDIHLPEIIVHIELIAVGQKMPVWVNRGFADYQQRFKGDMTLGLTEIPLQKRSDSKQIAAAMLKEQTQIHAAIPEGAWVITLDIAGKQYTSEQLAHRLGFWQENYRHIALIIGAPEGLTPATKALAAESWSLSQLTLPHPLVRIVVAEALYRALSINRHHPYHRA